MPVGFDLDSHALFGAGGGYRPGESDAIGRAATVPRRKFPPVTCGAPDVVNP